MHFQTLLLLVLRAVFRPIPGNLENSLTAFSSKDEEYCWLLIVVFTMQVQIYKKKRFKTIFVQCISFRAFFGIFAKTEMRGEE